MARGGGFLRQAWFYELSSEEEEQEKYLHPSSSALSAGGNPPSSSSSASSAQCFAVKPMIRLNQQFFLMKIEHNYTWHHYLSQWDIQLKLGPSVTLSVHCRVRCTDWNALGKGLFTVLENADKAIKIINISITKIEVMNIIFDQFIVYEIPLNARE